MISEEERSMIDGVLKREVTAIKHALREEQSLLTLAREITINRIAEVLGMSGDANPEKVALEVERLKAAVDAAAETIAGRLDKPFHRPECQCESCESWCKANPVSMSITDAVDILRRHNAWRRGGDGDMEDPTLVGIAIDRVIRAAEYLVSVTEATPFDDQSELSQLREDNARLRALHAEYRADINRLNEMLRATGYGQGQIDAYVAQCEELERVKAELEKANDQLEKVRDVVTT